MDELERPSLVKNEENTLILTMHSSSYRISDATSHSPRHGQMTFLLKFIDREEEFEYLRKCKEASQRTTQLLALGVQVSIAVGLFGSSEFGIDSSTVCLVVASAIALLQLVASICFCLDPHFVFFLTTVSGCIFAYGSIMISQRLVAVMTYVAVIHVLNANPRSGFPIMNFSLMLFATEAVMVTSLIVFIYSIDIAELAHLGPPYSEMVGFLVTHVALLYGTFQSQRSQKKAFAAQKVVGFQKNAITEHAIEKKEFHKERQELRHEVFMKNMEAVNAPLKETIDLDSPWDKAMKILADLKDNPDLDHNTFCQVKDISVLLASSHIFNPDLEKALGEKIIEVDEETERYILDIFDRKRSQPSASFIVAKPLELPGQLTSMPKRVTDSDISVLHNVMGKTEDWAFDVFEVHNLTKGHPLLVMGMALFKKYDLIDKFKVDEVKLGNFLKAIENGYQNMPYHNSSHAADVTRAVHYFLWTANLKRHFTDQEIFAAVVSSIVHDFDHPGINNNYLINTRESRAMLYNDKSVLENYHAAQAHLLASREENNIFKGVERSDYKTIRKIIIDMVLATDLSKHFKLVGTFKTSVSGGNLDLGEAEDRLLLLQMCLKCGDLNHAAKPLRLHKIWSMKVTEEFYRQGDLERAHGLQISPFMDRTTANLSKSQVGFMQFLVSPMYTEFMNFIDPHKKLPVLEYLEANHKHWKDTA